MDITESLAFEKFLHNYNGTGDPAVEVREFFTTDVKSLLECLIQEAQLPIDKTPEHMDRADKLKFLGYLDSKGAFLITKSSERVCEYLGISRYTLYNYLDLLRSKQEYTDSILASMRWLGLDWDGGLTYQTRRTDLYNSYVDKLLETGHATGVPARLKRWRPCARRPAKTASNRAITATAARVTWAPARGVACASNPAHGQGGL